jgi:GLPGLI family protein
MSASIALRPIIFLCSLVALLGSQRHCNAQANGSTLPQGSIIYRQQIGALAPPEAVLVFSSTNSLYYSARKDVAQPSLEMKQVASNSETHFKYDLDIQDQEGQCNYIDRAASQVVSRHFEVGFRKNVLITEPIPDFKWAIKPTTKTLGKYQVQLATTSFRGRQYEAWFAPELPLPLGPWKFGGLPGLILEVYDTQRLFLFEATAIDLPATVRTPVVAPTQGLPVAGWAAYCALTKAAEARMIKFAQSRPGVKMSISRAGSLEVIE